MRTFPPLEGLPHQKGHQVLLSIWCIPPENHGGGPVPADLEGTLLQIFPIIDMLACFKALSLLLVNWHAANLPHHGQVHLLDFSAPDKIPDG